MARRRRRSSRREVGCSCAGYPGITRIDSISLGGCQIHTIQCMSVSLKVFFPRWTTIFSDPSNQTRHSHPKLLCTSSKASKLRTLSSSLEIKVCWLCEAHTHPRPNQILEFNLRSCDSESNHFIPSTVFLSQTCVLDICGWDVHQQCGSPG